MLLCARNDFARYLIQCPDECEFRYGNDTHFLLVPDPDDPAEPFWLFDEFLLEAARSGDFGLRIASETPLN